MKFKKPPMNCAACGRGPFYAAPLPGGLCWNCHVAAEKVEDALRPPFDPTKFWEQKAEEIAALDPAFAKAVFRSKG